MTNENNCRLPLVNLAKPGRSFNVMASVINGKPVAAIDVAKAMTTIVNLSGFALKIENRSSNCAFEYSVVADMIRMNVNWSTNLKIVTPDPTMINGIASFIVSSNSFLVATFTWLLLCSIC
ncbi:hypothetical protein SDC9_132100 [bioreactor metagenome]|uniref:Uncharacterized protein n=1 Tax=bioreactor metagenome TaxID=1076179 RepID=A0A645D7V3_9ZZZZ